MYKGCVLKGIAFLAGAIIFSSIAPSGVHAEHYVSKHGGGNSYSSYSSNHHGSKEPWLDVDIVQPQPARVEYHRTVVQHNYYEDDDDDRYEHKHHKKRHYYSHHNKHRHSHHNGCCLPNGWYTRIRRGCVMPYDIYEYREAVPQHVLVTMPPQPPGVVHIMVGGKVVRLMEATRTIMDVFDI